jgi:DNA-binding MarR family transcriptional regulator/N-acetylglutamate synthase-like GNAT family acetyltransferase
MAVPQFADRIGAVRRFNRFYTRQIGLLQDGMVDTRFSLTEARVLYELGQAPETTATAIAATLGLDHGYLSRILGEFAETGLITRKPSPDDGRQTLLALSAKGRATFRKLDRGSQNLVGALLETMAEPRQQQMIEAMQTIERCLAPDAAPPTIVLRPHRAGDMGWVLSSHAACYGKEYGWSGTFEVLAAEIVTQFLREFDPARERCWIAEMNGVRVGSVFMVKGGEEVAKLRLLLVEPQARGLGLGRRLVDECVRFAREARYRRITLWTQSILTSARTIYERAGFRLVREEPHCSFGHDLIGETWELDL